jgi:D-alanine-D-alanine ligase
MNNDMLKGLAIGVLYGGPSSEREVSIQSGENVAYALSKAGHDVHQVLLDGSFTANDARSLGIDVAFLALHGEFGEDGRIQAILEEADIPYTGSGVDASSTAFDKVLAKRAYENHNVRTPAWMSLDVCELERAGGFNGLCLLPPMVVKPALGGSSQGITIVRDEASVTPAINKAFEFADSILVERYVRGRELTVGVIGDQALPVTELKPAGEFFDYDSKYTDNGTHKECPAQLNDILSACVQALALAAHKALGCRDVSRTDIILGEDGLPWVLETNTIPGMTSHSLLPMAAEAAGMSYTELCEKLLRMALARTLVKR